MFGDICYNLSRLTGQSRVDIDRLVSRVLGWASQIATIGRSEMGTDERSAGRKRQILDAAAAVFARRGYHGARMDDIVGETGLSKGSLYWHFSSKEQLAVALVHRELAAEEAAMSAQLDRPGSSEQMLEPLVREYARAIEAQPERASLTLELLALSNTIPEIKQCFSDHHDRYLSQLRALISREPGYHDATAATAATLAAVVDGLVLRWTLAAQPFSLEDHLWASVQQIIASAQRAAD